MDLEHIDAMRTTIEGIIGLCIIGGFILIGRSFASFIAKKILENVGRGIEDIKKAVVHSKTDIGSVIRKNNLINMEVDKILACSEAKRVSIFLFHNGSVFSTANPVWKISQTYEACANGVSSEISRYQEIKASMMTPLCYALFFGKLIDKGITKVNGAKCNNQETYKLSTNNIDERFLYTMMKSRGGTYSYMRSITNLENNILGFVLLEYSETFENKGDEYVKTTQLCDAVDRIYNLIR